MLDAHTGGCNHKLRMGKRVCQLLLSLWTSGLGSRRSSHLLAVELLQLRHGANLLPDTFFREGEDVWMDLKKGAHRRLAGGHFT